MGGINIYCGSFEGEDKSGSPFQAVLAAMDKMASAPERSIIARILAAMPQEDDHLLIAPDDARALAPLLRRYAAQIDGQLASPGDPFDQMTRDERASPDRITELQYGESVGWLAYCAQDLLQAFETAVAEQEEVALVW
ncbi:MAG TPA: hypothetical protein VGI95_15180 [Caulobacteraceae bacterium]|jgi:hypothetical protein